MSDPFTAAWEEGMASVPSDVEFYYTLEFRHPAFVEGSPAEQIAIRIVTEVWDDLILTIEDGNPIGGGYPALFKAIPFRADPPVFEEGKMPETTITIDNCGRELIPHLEEAVKIKADLICVYREYRSDDTSEPCYGPVEFVMRNVRVSGTSVSGTARLDDLANSKFPRRVYTITEFPGLIP
jgi:hypothetical protein